MSRVNSAIMTMEMDLLCYEIVRAKGLHPGDFKNLHEAYAVILEEMDELWTEIKTKQPSKEKCRTEARQVAAMCIRLITELTM